ncbi:DUF5681 domain-containing protein [Phreatobacter oligotrophus]|uniref:DUF5681 domain-containing protein n=1 Tax=Phreatobacter oligotrophus TaxID=1122261 RepID=A0A2T4YY45_9HYPH|nr:DUF5681 domain-containing protein [Phreatobacter oligotrophus]PTM51470.1 hypothetical protein C8P69_110136 [Phreatobacter oligotrophus]
MTKTPSKAPRGRSKKPLGDYEVGYCKPPKHGQFGNGQKPNSKGRPKNRPTVHDQVSALLARKIDVPENGVIVKRTIQETMFLAVGQKAVRGDLKAVAFLLNLREATRDSTSTVIDPTELAAFDQATLRRYMQAVIDREGASGPESPVSGDNLAADRDQGADDGARH